MSRISTILARFTGVKRSGNGWSARCPVHEDRTASLSISEGEGRRILVHCHAGCETTDVLCVVGLTMADLFDEETSLTMAPRRRSRGHGRVFRDPIDAVTALEAVHGALEHQWPYHDSKGNIVGVVVRWRKINGKEFRPVSRYTDGWRLKAMSDPRPLYGLPLLADARRVIVVEGEKAADAARSLGLVATTSVGGANAAHRSDWHPLLGKEVWILPDNDAPGRKYAETVAEILLALDARAAVRIVELPSLPKGGDIVDWIDAKGPAAGRDQLRSDLEKLAGATELWQVDREDDFSFRPFPIDALPEPIRRFVTAAAITFGCDQSYVALPLLTVLAAAIGNSRRLELKHGWHVPPIIWSAIVGESGTLKTPAINSALEPVHSLQQRALEQHKEAIRQYELDLVRWEKGVAEWKRKPGDGSLPRKPVRPNARRFLVADTTVEALAPILEANSRGLLLARDELAGWIASFDRYVGKTKSGADSANWLSMFSAGNLIVDRKLGDKRTYHVTRAAVCITGGIQPAILRRALRTDHRESGLAARLLLAYPPRKPKRWTDADIDPANQAEIARLVERLHELVPKDDDALTPLLVSPTNDARSVWAAFFDSHAIEQADLTSDLAAAWSKLEEYAARLALVIHFIRWAANDPSLARADQLDDISMRDGVRLVSWFKREARRVYAMLDESDAQRNQRRLFDWITQKGGRVSTREVSQGCRWLKQTGAAEAALEELVQDGRGSWEQQPRHAKGGRPGRMFRTGPMKGVEPSVDDL